MEDKNAPYPTESKGEIKQIETLGELTPYSDPVFVDQQEKPSFSGQSGKLDSAPKLPFNVNCEWLQMLRSCHSSYTRSYLDPFVL